uniref:Uncharacterized protein n=1 Tax=Octopus bimaculoides TaxID=37653 RepID=A0A0L8H4Y5_OCTBM
MTGCCFSDLCELRVNDETELSELFDVKHVEYLTLKQEVHSFEVCEISFSCC